jgi:hypothetical protein
VGVRDAYSKPSLNDVESLKSTPYSFWSARCISKAVNVGTPDNRSQGIH